MSGYRTAMRTHAGHVRTLNEDSAMMLPERGLWAEPDPEVLAEMQRIYLDVEGDLRRTRDPSPRRGLGLRPPRTELSTAEDFGFRRRGLGIGPIGRLG